MFLYINKVGTELHVFIFIFLQFHFHISDGKKLSANSTENFLRYCTPVNQGYPHTTSRARKTKTNLLLRVILTIYICLIDSVFGWHRPCFMS